MVDRSQLLELVPHYLAMLVVVFAALTTVRSAVGNVGLVGEFAVVLAVVFLYRPVVLRLGVAPSMWERE